MVDIINIIGAVLSIGLGAVGWFAPRYVADVLDFETRGNSTMGLSETRAASGALFVGLGVGALLLGSPVAYAMVGFAWGGAALGRITSILLDGAQPTKKIAFFVIEVAVAVPLLLVNL